MFRLRIDRFHIHALLAAVAEAGRGPLSVSKWSCLYTRVISRAAEAALGRSRPRNGHCYIHVLLAGAAEAAPGRPRLRNCRFHAHAYSRQGNIFLDRNTSLFFVALSPSMVFGLLPCAFRHNILSLLIQ